MLTTSAHSDMVAPTSVVTCVRSVAHATEDGQTIRSSQEEVIMQPFLALITPVGDTGGGGGPPLGTWGGAGQPFPTPPIVVPPGGAYPPGFPPGYQPPRPTNPIHLGPGGEIGGPPGYWGGGNVPYPTPPIYIPIVPGGGDGGEEPTPPIYIPVPIPPGLPPAEVAKIIKQAVDFWTGNLPENPGEVPTPV
jgi:hypothetical protein